MTKDQHTQTQQRYVGPTRRLLRTPYEGTFFINIRYMFNGDRLAFVKGYARNGAKLPDGKVLSTRQKSFPSAEDA